MAQFLRPQSEHIGDRCADAVHRALEGGGAELVSLGEVSRRLRMTKSGLHRAVGGRAGLVEIVVRFFGERWYRWSVNPYRADEDVLPLPDGDEQVAAVRTWATLSELAAAEARAGRPAAALRVARFRRDETAELASSLWRAIGRRPTPEEVVGVRAMIDGLRAAVAAATDPIPVWTARPLLAAHVEWLRSSAELGGLDETRSVPGDQPPADELGRQ